jgi:uncharacterized membrane protein
MKQDVIKALKEMFSGTVVFFILAGKFLAAMTVGLTLLALLVYAASHWFFQCLTVMIIIALGSWFLVELDIAHRERQEEEKNAANHSNVA